MLVIFVSKNIRRDDRQDVYDSFFDIWQDRKLQIDVKFMKIDLENWKFMDINQKTWWWH